MVAARRSRSMLSQALAPWRTMNGETVSHLSVGSACSATMRSPSAAWTRAAPDETSEPWPCSAGYLVSAACPTAG